MSIIFQSSDYFQHFNFLEIIPRAVVSNGEDSARVLDGMDAGERATASAIPDAGEGEEGREGRASGSPYPRAGARQVEVVELEELGRCLDRYSER